MILVADDEHCVPGLHREARFDDQPGALDKSGVGLHDEPPFDLPFDLETYPAQKIAGGFEYSAGDSQGFVGDQEAIVPSGSRVDVAKFASFGHVQARVKQSAQQTVQPCPYWNVSDLAYYLADHDCSPDLPSTFEHARHGRAEETFLSIAADIPRDAGYRDEPPLC